ncbi:MAG: hypothetical protein SFY81_00170 [Verrucomicrobiota bacterium]|nr:hypothetical protein [Verrucomicrobiota bacterium]
MNRVVVKSAVVCVLTVFCFGLSGCANITDYSVTSYQGPLPMKDYDYVTVDGKPIVGPAGSSIGSGRP